MNKKVEIVFPGVDREKISPEAEARLAALEKSLQEHLEKAGVWDEEEASEEE